jgi:signal transduction histidine kinase
VTRLLGGNISAESARGEGCRFIIEFPRRHTDEVSAA